MVHHLPFVAVNLINNPSPFVSLSPPPILAQVNRNHTSDDIDASL